MAKPSTISDEEYRAFDGMHAHLVWFWLPETWRCPVCNRTKRGILQWRKRKGSNARKYGPAGWSGAVHSHHDHGIPERFNRTQICGACNSLDARLKRRLGVPESFSFSPHEMRACLDLSQIEDHKPIPASAIDFELARTIASLLIHTTRPWASYGACRGGRISAFDPNGNAEDRGPV